MRRYFTLVLLNVFGWYLLGMAHWRLGLVSQAPEWLVLSVVASWGFPVTPLALVVPLPRHRVLDFVILISVPLLWAAMVEWLLRRFVDRSKSSDSA